MSISRYLLLIGAAAGLAAACSSTPKPQPEKSEPVASPAVANEKLGGTWLLSIQRGGQSTDYSLHLQLTAGELAGSLTNPDGNSREVGKVALAGDKVTWEIGSSSQSGMVQRFEGKLTGASSMEGSIKMVRADRSGKKGGGRSGTGSSSGGDSGDSSGSSSGDGTAPSDGGGTTSGGSGYSGHGGRGGHGRGSRGGSGGTPVTWRAYKTVELPAIPAPTPAKAGL